MPEKHFDFLKHLFPDTDKKKKEESKKKPGPAGSPLESARPETSLAEKKEQAIQALLAGYQELKKQALSLRQKAGQITSALELLSQAKTLLNQAEKLQSAKVEEISEDELNKIIEQYGKIEIEPALAKAGLDSLTATTPEGKEITLDFKEQLKYWSDFYLEQGVDWVSLPESIKITPDQAKEMTRLITEHGFDKLLIIPENLVGESTLVKGAGGKVTSIQNDKYAKLHQLMSQGYKETYQGDNYKADGSFHGSLDKTAKLRLILTKDVQNLADDPLFKATKGKSIEDLEKDELTRFTGLSESSYLIYQKEYHNRAKKHLDEDGWTWLPESTRPLSGRVPGGGWVPGGGQLSFYSDARDGRYDSLGCRLAGSFEINI